MDIQHRKLSLIRKLLRHISRSAQDPAEFQLFIEVLLCDMASCTKARPVLDSGWNIGFRCVLCRDDAILAAALPYAVREDGRETPLLPWEEAALRTAGIPLFDDLLAEVTMEDGEKVLSLKSFACPDSSGWRFPTVAVPREAEALLVKKGLASERWDTALAPTGEGTRLGLCAALRFQPASSSCVRSLSCSAAGWLYRLWVPGKAAPLWVAHPLDTRLVRMRTGRAGNVGHTVSALERLDAMPMEPLLLEYIGQKYLEEHLGRFQMQYRPGVTYGQAARDADRRMRSGCGEDRETGMEVMDDLAALFSCAYSFRKPERGARKGPKKITEIHKTKLTGRSLSQRLAWAGISENRGNRLPLVGDDLEDVFQGLSALLGTDEPARSFYRDALPRIMPGWNRSEEQRKRWDGTFDGLLAAVDSGLDTGSRGNERASDNAPSCLSGFWEQVKWRLVIEPFCLLDQVRQLEEERGRLLESFQEENKGLKQRLEGMNFGGDVF